MDYIYQGEVQVLQNDLNGFLDVAQRLKIEGLIGNGEEENIHANDDDKKDLMDATFEQKDNGMTVLDESLMDTLKQDTTIKRRAPKAERTVSVVSNSSNFDPKAAVDDLVEKTEDGWRCKACGKISTSKTTSDIRRHAEMHIEGLSFDCQLCDKTFRSRQNLAKHKQFNHRGYNI